MSAKKNKPSQDASASATNVTDAAFADQSIKIETAADEDGIEGQLEAKLDEMNDRNLRLHAEMENLRQRTAREISEQRRYAAMPLIRDLLDVGDNVIRAIEAAEATSEVDSLLEGFRLVAQQLQTTLQKHHCSPIDAVGQPFDPNLHASISQMSSDEYPAGLVSLETQVGYLLHDRVVRPSQVIVSTGPAETSG